ncbi:uncharacterized protein LOC133319580 [Danaus plexippus]|uniref:uncharacterized protein LOC133319580 n=1 Tax=Danaus plexippus TaxID=13037 RepID=UPI002AB1F6B7|nr:uncharacterized protein LOC133319580 [Danaus plexippus]
MRDKRQQIVGSSASVKSATSEQRVMRVHRTGRRSGNERERPSMDHLSMNKMTHAPRLHHRTVTTSNYHRRDTLSKCFGLWEVGDIFSPIARRQTSQCFVTGAGADALLISKLRFRPSASHNAHRNWASGAFCET